MLQITGRIHSVESFGTSDGPGIRYVVFLQGCRFRCIYCHNPDTWTENAGALITTHNLCNQVLRYIPYFESSGGGVTVSGGEPLLQAAFVAQFFRKLKQEGVHTCLDTSGYIPTQTEPAVLDELISYTDLVLLDVKHADPEAHHIITGHSNCKSLHFAQLLEQHQTPVWLRYVVVPGYTDHLNDISAFQNYAASFSNVQKIEYLPFHKMGEYKWDALNLPYQLKDVQPPTPEFMSSLIGTDKHML